MKCQTNLPYQHGIRPFTCILAVDMNIFLDLYTVFGSNVSIRSLHAADICTSWHAKKAFRDHVSIYEVVRLART